MNPLLQKHKKIVMLAGIGIIWLGLAGLRWMMSYSPTRQESKTGSGVNDAEQNSNTLFVRAFLCKKTKFVDNLMLTGTLQGGARIEMRFNRDGKISKLN